MSFRPNSQFRNGYILNGRTPLSIRWRLASGSAVLTLVILCAFAGVEGTVTIRRIQDEFNQGVRQRANSLVSSASVSIDPSTGFARVTQDLRRVAYDDGEAARIVNREGRVLATSARVADLGPPASNSTEHAGWRVENRAYPFNSGLVLQYGQRRGPVEATVRFVRLFLFGGVIGGAALALLAGLAVARRAIRPISELTAAAREIQKTRDPSRRILVDGADDEIAELARTLDGMLRSLDAARNEQQLMLARQREFVADASHELRTPLTSVMANLDLLAETLDGDHGEAARAALRSSHRMQRLVQDLMLLARTDARAGAEHEPLDLGRVLVEAAAEVAPIADDHHLTVTAGAGLVNGSRDELHRLALNLLANAVRHTPAGTPVRATVERRDTQVSLVVEDDGPGIPDDLREKLLDRFVRGGGDRAGSSGLGLAIVRAVAEAHGGQVVVSETHPGYGARFTVTLPGLDLDASSWLDGLTNDKATGSSPQRS